MPLRSTAARYGNVRRHQCHSDKESYESIAFAPAVRLGFDPRPTGHPAVLGTDSGVARLFYLGGICTLQSPSDDASCLRWSGYTKSPKVVKSQPYWVVMTQSSRCRRPRPSVRTREDAPRDPILIDEIP